MPTTDSEMQSSLPCISLVARKLSGHSTLTSKQVNKTMQAKPVHHVHMHRPRLTTMCACLQLLLKRMDVLETELVMTRQEKNHLQSKLEDALMQLSHSQAQLQYARSVQVRKALTSDALQVVPAMVQVASRQ
jgi:hypothetical protein